MRQGITFVLAVVVAGIAFGYLNGYVRAHGGQGASEISMATGALGFAVVLVSIVSTFAGNRNIARASSEAEARAKQFRTAPSGLVSVYIFREAVYARFLGLDLYVDEVLIGQTRGRTFFCLSVPPGSHRLSAVNPQDKTRSDLDLVLRAETSFVQQSLKLGATGAKHSLSICEPEFAQSRINRCRMLVPNKVV